MAMIRPCSSSVPGSSDQVIITLGGMNTWPSALTRKARSMTSITAAMSSATGRHHVLL